MILTALYDSKTQKYFNFVTADSIERIKREYSIMLKSEQKNSLTMFPEDFILCIIADINDDTGLVVSNLKNVCQLVELKNSIKKE